MTTVKLNNYRQASRKVRLLADLIRGKRADRAAVALSFAGKRAADPVAKLLASGIAAEKQTDATASPETLYVTSIFVNKGFIYKRMRPRAFGRGAPIRKETCHVTLTLGQGKANSKQQTANSTKPKRTKKEATTS